MPIYFFSKGAEQHRFLSNFHPVDITIEGKVWPSVEHYYQGQKFLDEWLQEYVRKLPTAAATKHFAKRNQHLVRMSWEQVKVDYMRVAVYTKFSQHEELWKQLDATGDEELIEDSPWDSFWGSGREGKGQNMLGKILMETRAVGRELRALAAAEQAEE